jgi:hypothetical protein
MKDQSSWIRYALDPLPFLALALAVLFTACSSSPTPAPSPSISAFTPANSPITAGQSALVTAIFSNGSGTVDNGIGPVASGVPFSTGMLQTTTTFTLTVTSSVGSASQKATVTVVADPTEPVVTVASALTAGASATASVPAQDGCTYGWTVNNATNVSGATAPTVQFTAGSSGYVQLACVVTNSLNTPSTPGWGIAQVVPAPVTPAVSAPAAVTAGQTGCTASVPAVDGDAYAWSITGGNITDGAQNCTVTYTAGASGSVQLSCVLINAAGTPASAGIANSIIESTPAAPAISTASGFTAATTGTASVTPLSDCTYAWTLSGGTFIGGSTGCSVSFAVNPVSPLVLGCTATNLLGMSSPAGTVSVPVTFTNDQVLSALNLNIDTPPLQGANGQTLTDNDQPLGKPVVNLHQIMNLFETDPANGPNLTVADGSETYTARTIASPSELSGYQIQIPVAADLNGDGKQEVVLVCLPGPGHTNDHIGVFRITGGAAQTAAFVRSFSWAPATMGTGSTRDWYFKISVAAGDLTGSGTDNIVIWADGTLFVLDATLTPYALSASDSTVTAVNGAPLLCVTCADLDHTGNSEVILVNGGYDSGTAAQISIYQFSVTGQGAGAFTHLVDSVPVTMGGVSLRSANVKAGDLAADGNVEVVLCGVRADQDEIRTMIMQVSVSNGAWTAAFLPACMDEDLVSTMEGFINPNGGVWKDWTALDSAIPPLALGDLDGSGQLEIVADTDVLSYTAATSSAAATLSYAYDSTSHHALWGDVTYTYGTGVDPTRANRRANTAAYNQCGLGLVNPGASAQKEIYMLDMYGNDFRRYYYDPTIKEIRQGANVPIGNQASVAFPFMCMVDLTANTTMVQYIGHGLVYSNPIPTVVLASSPYWDNMGQNIGNCFTEFGQSVGGSVGGGATIGFSEGATVGAKITIPIVSNGELEVKCTVQESWDFAYQVTYGFVRNIAYDTYAGTHAVLFAAVPIDVYAYQCTEAGQGSQLTVGQIVYIKQARPAQLQFTDVDYYNEHCGFNPPIGSSILPMTLGAPHTYPSQSAAAGLVSTDPTQAFLLSNAQSGILPEGNLVNSMSYATSLNQGVSASYSTSITGEWEASFALLLGGSTSASIGFTINSEVDLGTSIMGSVGGLPAAYYGSDTIFQWGIFSYTAPLGSGGVKVISYWVQ